MRLSRPQTHALAGHSACDPRTIAKAYAGEPVTSATLARLHASALALGLDPPPLPALAPAKAGAPSR